MKNKFNIVFAIGGIGKRMNCQELGHSSKAFLTISNTTLIEKLINYVIQTFGDDTTFQIAVTNKFQEEELNNVLKGKEYKYKIVYNGKRIFDLIKPNKVNLLIFGDTYITSNIFKRLYNNYLITEKSQLVLLNTTNGIDNVKFKINKKTLFVEKIIPGKQTQEISQIFLFNKKDSNLIYELNIQNMSRFDILYKILLPNSNLCVHNCNKECYNINEFSDYEEVRRKYENI